MAVRLSDEITRLDRDERLDLLDALWQLVRDDALPVPDSHARELSRRLDADEPSEAWATVRERLRPAR